MTEGVDCKGVVDTKFLDCISFQEPQFAITGIEHKTKNQEQHSGAERSHLCCLGFEVLHSCAFIRHGRASGILGIPVWE